MRNKLKKSPEDYKIFSFRCDDETKHRLSKDIESVRVGLNSRIKPDEKVWRKNDVIIKSLEMGLHQLKSKAKRK